MPGLGTPSAAFLLPVSSFRSSCCPLYTPRAVCVNLTQSWPVQVAWMLLLSAPWYRQGGCCRLKRPVVAIQSEGLQLIGAVLGGAMLDTFPGSPAPFAKSMAFLLCLGSTGGVGGSWGSHYSWVLPWSCAGLPVLPLLHAQMVRVPVPLFAFIKQVFLTRYHGLLGDP